MEESWDAELCEDTVERDCKSSIIAPIIVDLQINKTQTRTNISNWFLLQRKQEMKLYGSTDSLYSFLYPYLLQAGHVIFIAI